MARLRATKDTKVREELAHARASLEVLGRLGPHLGDEARDASRFLTDYVKYVKECDEKLVRTVLRVRADLAPSGYEASASVAFGRLRTASDAEAHFVQTMRYWARSKVSAGLGLPGLLEELETRKPRTPWTNRDVKPSAYCSPKSRKASPGRAAGWKCSHAWTAGRSGCCRSSTT